MKYLIALITTTTLLSCSKHENRMEGTWFVEYFENDLKTNDFTMLFEEGGKGKVDGITNMSWSVNKKDLTLIINDYKQEWENNRNKKNIQFYLSNDTLGNFLRMEMERIE